MTAHIQAISDQSLESSTPVLYNLDNKTLNNLITVLSYTLQAVVNSHESILETSHNVFITQAPESDSPKGENIRTVIGAPHGCDSHIGKEGLISTKQVVRLVADIHQTASDLMLVRKNRRVLGVVNMSDHTFDINCVLLEVHLVPWGSGAQSQHWSHYPICHIPKLHSHQQRLNHLLHPWFSDSATAWSGKWRERERAASTVCPQRAHWARPQPIHLGSLSHKGRHAVYGHDDLKDKQWSYFFCFLFPAEWTSCQPESVQVWHEKKDPHSNLHSASQCRAANSTKKCMLQLHVSVVCSTEGATWRRAPWKWLTPTTYAQIFAVEKLWAWVRPPPQPGQLPQLQHYPGALAAGHKIQCGVYAAVQ